jgi:hypothetical protein
MRHERPHNTVRPSPGAVGEAYPPDRAKPSFAHVSRNVGEITATHKGWL